MEIKLDKKAYEKKVIAGLKKDIKKAKSENNLLKVEVLEKELAAFLRRL